MKHLLLIACFSLTCSSLFAQSEHRTIVKTEAKVVNGADMQKMFGNVVITDPKIYDQEGNVVDSAEAVRLLKTYDYQLGWRKNKDGEFKKLLTKIDPERQAMTDASTKISLRPASLKLQEGVVLDLKPLGKDIDRKTTEGKAVMLIFWCDGCFSGSTPDAYAAINDVLSTYFNPDKLEILTITHHPIEVASAALKKNPIVNTQHIVDAGKITAAYETGNRPVIVLTDKDHKIVYSITNNAMMTPRILNKIFKELL